MAAPGGPLAALLQPSLSLADAVNSGNVGVGYAGGGFLVLYFLGVSKTLQQLGIARPGSVRTAGASVGALVQLADQPGSWPHDEYAAKVGELFDLCRSERNCIQTLDARVAQFAAPLVERVWAGASGRVCVAISLADEGPEAKGASTCSFSGPADFLSAARAACYVPGWSGPEAAMSFRGRKVFDGAFTHKNPCPPGVAYCIKVAVLTPWDVAATIQGLPGSLPLTASMLTDIATKAMGMDPAGFVEVLANRGLLPRRDGIAQAPFDWQGTLPFSKNDADIYPGKYSKSPFTPEQIALMTFVPADAGTRRTLYEMGQADARAWAREQGWPGA
ncbi:hypothetical protein Rsub_00888 [Raphidocelis subcapitata]|uniref:PNPLA domain-containing protein n=1 Tax=Raphidocelis subcapitata TaxID=307507 RepID=A0A2V0NLA0_9CHLO|nr:hypothetical protein Rsub_00888 [Raphidocelis subcapitata]|eukprot:GBF88176.1 hypothetical protein Rsub_00888 [Raphidocelis subcapitata]